MAVYLYNEYFADYPYRPTTMLDKFISAEKNLHEMSLSEINAFVSGWKPLSSGTAIKLKRQIKSYFDFLKLHGVKTNSDLYLKLNIPVKTNEYLIYSTDDIRKYWNILLAAMENYAHKTGKFFSPNVYYVAIAAGILSFYGLDTEEIFNLPRFDVTPEGVKGYNLPLTQDDIDDLMRYRDLKQMSNNMVLMGDMYIRSGKPSATGTIPRDYLTTALRRSDNVDEDHKYLKPYLTDTYLFKMGMFDRAYKYERENNVIVEFDRNTPEWFSSIMNDAAKDTLLKLKKEYIEYRSERRGAEKAQPQQPKVIINTINDEPDTKQNLERQLSEIYAAIGKLGEQTEQLKEQARIICDKIKAIK